MQVSTNSVHTDTIEEIRVLFGNRRFSEQDIINHIHDEYLKVISHSEALKLCSTLLESYCDLYTLNEHIDMIAFDYVTNLKS